VFVDVFFTLNTILFTVFRYHVTFLSNLKFKNQKLLKTPFSVRNILHKQNAIAKVFIVEMWAKLSSAE